MKRLFIDVETTGVDPKLHAIHQLAGYFELNDEIVDEFNIKIRPHDGAEITQEALDVCGVTKEEIMSYPDALFGFIEFLRLLDKHIYKFDKKDKAFFVGYNGNFDKNFVHEFFERHKNEERSSLFAYIWGNIIDVMSEASVQLQFEREHMKNFKLMSVVAQLGIDIDISQLHDAMYDIFLTREIFYLIQCDKPRNLYDVDVVKVVTNSIDIHDKLKKSEPINKHEKQLIDSWNVDQEIDKKVEPVVVKPGQSALDALLGVTKMPTTAKIPTKTKSLKKTDDLSCVISFGKHKGQTVDTVLGYAASYLIWMHDNCIQGYHFGPKIMDLAVKKAEEQKSNFVPANSLIPSSLQEETLDDVMSECGMADNDLPF